MGSASSAFTNPATASASAGPAVTAIARRAGVSIAAIRTLNPKSVSATGHIRAGATLLIPAADRARTLPSTLRSNPERLALRPAQLDTYAETLAEELPDSLTRADIAALGLQEGLATAIDGPARACVGEALRRCV
jgi:hypothetical protein